MRISAAATLLLALTLHSDLVGQLPLATGDTVRIRERSGVEHRGVVAGVSPGELRLVTRSGAYAIPEGEIATLERSLGQQRRFGRNFLVTMGVAAGTLGVVSALSWEPCTGFCILGPTTRSDAFVWGLAGGAILGAPIGLIVGLAVKSERWEAIPTPAPAGLALSLRRSSRGLDFVASLPVGGGGR